MPRASLNPDNAAVGGGGNFQPGVYLFAGTKFQNIKTNFAPTSPHLVTTAKVCDKDGDPVRDADDAEITFGCGRQALEKFHPGRAEGADDDDPQDQGDEVDAEGNTLYAVEDGAQLHDSTAIVVFTKSLVKLGFPKEMLDKSYAPMFDGMKVELEQMPAIEINKWLGTRLNTKPMKRDDGTEQPVLYKVAKRWLNPAYLNGDKGKAKGGKSEAATSGAKGGKIDNVDDALKHILTVMGTKKAGKELKVAQIVPNVAQTFAQEKANFASSMASKMGDVQKKAKDLEFVSGVLAELGHDVAFDDDGNMTGVTFSA